MTDPLGASQGVSDGLGLPTNDGALAAFLADIGAPGIVDTHVHVMPDSLQQAVWRYFDALTDPPWPIAVRGTLEHRLNHLHSAGVIAHTALAYAHKPGMLGWLNGFTLDVADRHPQVIPTFTIFPDVDVDDQVQTALARGGRVCKVHTQVGRYHLDDARLVTTWAQLEESGVVVLAHVTAVYGVDGGGEFCGIDTLASLLDRHPGLRVIVAHLGMPELDDALTLAELAPGQVWLEPSMALHDGPHLRNAFSDVQLGRLAGLWPQLVFGTDFPAIPHDIAAQVRGLGALGLDRGQWRAVMHDTAAQLLGVATSDGLDDARAGAPTDADRDAGTDRVPTRGSIPGLKRP